MKEKKGKAIITIECDNKEELKNALACLKDAMESAAKHEAKDETDDKEPEAFRPKKGDICTYVIGSDVDAIFRYSGETSTDEEGDVFLGGNPSLVLSEDLLKPYMIIYGEGTEHFRDYCRAANEEETNLFNDKVKEFEENKKGDAEWAPRKGEDFWTVKLAFYAGGKFTPVRNPSDFWDSPVLGDVKELGWVFPTEEKCQRFCDKLNEAIKNVKP